MDSNTTPMDKEGLQAQNSSCLSLDEFQTPTTSKSSSTFPVCVTEKLEEDKVESEREMIAFNTQQLIDDINNKRKRDTALLQEYNEAREQRSRETHEVIEETIHQICGASNTILDARLHELYTVLDDISKVEYELASFREALSDLFDSVAPKK